MGLCIRPTGEDRTEGECIYEYSVSIVLWKSVVKVYNIDEHLYCIYI